MRLRRPVLAFLLAPLLAGCAQADDRTAVRATTERFFAALHAKDARAACAALSADTRAELESQEGRSCPRVVTSIQVQGGRTTRVEVDVTNAKVDLSSGESVFLGKTAVGWKLD